MNVKTDAFIMSLIDESFDLLFSVIHNFKCLNELNFLVLHNNYF